MWKEGFKIQNKALIVLEISDSRLTFNLNRGQTALKNIYLFSKSCVTSTLYSFYQELFDTIFKF